MRRAGAVNPVPVPPSETSVSVQWVEDTIVAIWEGDVPPSTVVLFQLYDVSGEIPVYIESLTSALWSDGSASWYHAASEQTLQLYMFTDGGVTPVLSAPFTYVF